MYPRRLVTIATVLILAVTLLLSLMPVALAAKPNNQACLGDDFSGYAQDGSDFIGGPFVGGAGFGGFIADFIAPEGAGGEVQAHLDGAVPDGDIPNSCNDPPT